MSPWALVYTDDNYYLLAYHKGLIKHFRVDRMEGVALRTIEQNGLNVIVPREGKEEFAKEDMSRYTNYTFSMYGGEVKNVEMVFLNRMLNTVIDRFGKDVLAYPVDKNHFKMLNLAGKRAQFQRNRCSTSPVLPLNFGGVRITYLEQVKKAHIKSFLAMMDSKNRKPQ